MGYINPKRAKLPSPNPVALCISPPTSPKPKIAIKPKLPPKKNLTKPSQNQQITKTLQKPQPNTSIRNKSSSELSTSSINNLPPPQAKISVFSNSTSPNFIKSTSKVTES